MRHVFQICINLIQKHKFMAPVTLHFVMVNVHTSNLSKGTSDDRGIVVMLINKLLITLQDSESIFFMAITTQSFRILCI